MTAINGERVYHGLSKDKRYWRWRIMHNRCYNEKNQAYSSYGAKGTAVDHAWHRDNPEGLYNFMEWLEIKLREANNPAKYVIVLQDRTKNYGPTNCAIANQQLAVQSREMNRYDFDQVVAMRRFKRANPKATLEEIVQQFGGNIFSLSKALTGVTYSNVNTIEPPIPNQKPRKPAPSPNSSIFALAASLK